jgi:hypothetical protein
VVILEIGVFSLAIFPNDASESISFVEELIEPYLFISEYGSIISVSGVHIYIVKNNSE